MSFMEKGSDMRERVVKVVRRLKGTFLTMYQVMSGPIQRARKSVRERIDERAVRPRSTLQRVFFVIYLVVFTVVVLWGVWWLPQVDVESARWALSAQAPTSGSILALLIAAMVFRWGIIVNREQGLWQKINLYLRELSGYVPVEKANELRPFVVEAIYDEYLCLISREKGRVGRRLEEALRMLGRFWVIKKLSLGYSYAPDMTVSRRLTEGMVRELAGVSKESAVSMWESYFVSPARFLLEMYGALRYVSRTLGIHRKHGELGIKDIQEWDKGWAPAGEYVILEMVVGKMRGDDTWLIASDVVRWKSIRVLFYLASGLLLTATIVALAILTGFGGFESLFVEHHTTFMWLIALPIGCAIFGAYVAMLSVFKMMQ